jgi:hypothetical protein
VATCTSSSEPLKCRFDQGAWARRNEPSHTTRGSFRWPRAFNTAINENERQENRNQERLGSDAGRRKELNMNKRTKERIDRATVTVFFDHKLAVAALSFPEDSS